MEDFNSNGFFVDTQTEYLRENRQGSHNEYYRRRASRQKRMRKRKIQFCLVVVALLVTMLVFVIVVINNKVLKNKKYVLEGTYVYEDNTEYEFDGKQNGCLCVVVDGEEYQFDYTYKTEDNRLYIDFENEEVTDITYEYSLDGNKLTLSGKEGSAGGSYELTKK